MHCRSAAREGTHRLGGIPRLVLTRRANRDPDDTLILHDKRTGETYRVVVTGIHGDNVRIGVVAPPHVSVDRSEIAALKQAELRQADTPVIMSSDRFPAPVQK